MTRHAIALAALLVLVAARTQADDDPEAKLLAEGRAVYDRTCAACHTLAPPPKTAPPIVGLAAHLRERFATREQAVAHIVAYVPAPSPSMSVLPPMAVQRFGLMPPLPLPEAELRAVASWLWQQYDPAFQHRGMGMGAGPGGPSPAAP